ncbi:SpoIID/LytB domain-containing protein [Nocardia jinanensis]|uniref:SpoIID/LytB domain-containing protein n=1 Tax=Nocardia jinanensis TaxID=382504 RepID=UPI001E3B7EC4|nr:SpoIID/LytB domain-containing protein [Nocardia jinanensis]
MKGRRIRPGPLLACGATALAIGATMLVPPADEVYRMLAEAGGPGHGRGLSQHGALHNADNGQNSDQILTYYYPGAELGTIGPASVSVRLQEQDNADLVVTSDAGMRLAGQALQAGEAVRLTPLPDGGAQAVVTQGCDGPVLWENPVQDPWIYPIDPTPGRPAAEHLTLCGGGAYRGSLGVAAENGETRTVNRLDIQDYLLGVVPAEMPPDWAPAALEAQAVAARSYALAETRWPYAQTCDTTDCQVYSGTAQEDPRTTAAVEATAGRVLLRDGRILRAEYSAAPDGGSPADIQTFEVGPTPAELTVTTPMPLPPPVNPDVATGLPEGTGPETPGPWSEVSPEGTKSGVPVPRTPEGSLPVSPGGTLPASPGIAPGSTPSPIETAYAEMGGAHGALGMPVTPELPLPEDAGRYRLFENGVIVYTAELGAQVVDFDTLMQLVPSLTDGAGSAETDGTTPGGTESGSSELGAGDSGATTPPGRMPAGRAVPEAETRPAGSGAVDGDRPAPVPGAQRIPTRMETTEVF